MNKSKNGVPQECPSCGETIFVKEPLKLGTILRCRFCGDDLEIVELDPLVLDWPMDSDDDEEFDDYDEAEYISEEDDEY
jgi:lysine biosynthesis protein LysW